MKNEKVIYYSDELNDEFSKAKIVPREINENYKYDRNFLWNLISALVQNVFSMPIKILYVKLKFHIKYIGKEKLKKYKDTGYFIYVNHTQAFGDTIIPSLPVFPKRNFFIVNPENVSMKGMQWLVESLGAIPIPIGKNGLKNFLSIISKHIQKKHAVTIYPEAHIWPYYTKIRPFKSVSFKYPIELNVPIFCMTNTYQKRKKSNKANIVTYIDGPFWPNENLSKRDKQEDLRNKVYGTMNNRSKNSNIEIVKFKKKTVQNEKINI